MTPFTTGITADADDFATALAVKWTADGREFLGATFADPATHVPLAESLGVTGAALADRDQMLIWLALDVGRAHAVTTIRNVARRALQAEGFWDRRGAIAFGPLWNDESLALLADSYPAGVNLTTEAVRYYASGLVASSRRWAMAEDLLRQFRELLSGETETSMIVSPRKRHGRRPAFILATGKRGVA